jgi:tetratricopeptide (TPR) repeat protein
MKDYKRAVASLDEAIKLKPDDYASLRNRADNYYEMKMYDLAIKDYDRAL